DVQGHGHFEALNLSRSRGAYRCRSGTSVRCRNGGCLLCDNATESRAASKRDEREEVTEYEVISAELDHGQILVQVLCAPTEAPPAKCAPLATGSCMSPGVRCKECAPAPPARPRFRGKTAQCPAWPPGSRCRSPRGA